MDPNDNQNDKDKDKEKDKDIENDKDKDEEMEDQDKVGELNADEEEGEEFINMEEVIEIEDINKDNHINDGDEDMDIEINDNDVIQDEEQQQQQQHHQLKEISTQEFPDFQAKGEIYSIALNQESNTLIIGDGENYTTFYDIANKKIISTNLSNNESVNFLKLSNDNKYLVSSSVDGCITIYDAKNDYKVLNQINDQSSEINWLEWHPKGPAFAFGLSDGSVWLYKANSIENNMSFFHHTESTTCGGFTKDGTLLISGSEDCTVRVYKLKEQSLLHTIKGKKFHQSGITCLSIASTRSLIATGSVNNEFALSNYENGNVFMMLANEPSEASIEAITFAFEEKYVVFADSQHKIKIFDMTQMQIRATVKLEDDNITKMVLSMKMAYRIFASGTSGNFYVIDTRGVGSITMKEQLHNDAIMDFVITNNEDFALTSSLDKTINLVKIEILNE